MISRAPVRRRLILMTIRWITHETPIGTLTLLADGRALTGVLLPGHRAGASALPSGRRHDAALGAAREQLDAYFAGELHEFDLPLAPTGTAFQHAVWRALRAVPYGATTSYGALASALGRPGAARAVGLANARNPIAIVVPCHRVVGAGGALTGYAGGLERKRALLELEGAVTAR